MTTRPDDRVVHIPALPRPLRAINAAEGVEVSEGSVSIRAGPRTDWFIDPGGHASVTNAPALLMPAEGDWMLSARASAEHGATFDAAVLVAYISERAWAKLCLERSPQGEVMIVSVVTRGASDDCNSFVVDGSEAYLRVSRLDGAFAFHASADGRAWRMIRYFSLGDEAAAHVEVGFLAQSPTGPGCRATFRDIRFVQERLGDLRSGV